MNALLQRWEMNYKTCAKILFFLLLVVCIPIGLYRFKGGYSLSKIISQQPHQILWSARPEVFEKIVHLLDQPFTYAGSGGTSFAFLGKDGNTILKLFKHQHLQAPSWLFAFSFPGMGELFRLEKILYREAKHHHKRIKFFFTSCAIAYDELKNETGLLFLALHKDPRYKKTVTLIDRLGSSLQVDLSQTEFAIQRRAIPLLEHLQILIDQGHILNAQQALESLVSLLAKRSSKGIADRDPHLSLNFGFIENQAVEFDIGSFSKEPHLSTASEVKKELFFATYELRQWLQDRSPMLQEHLCRLIAEFCNSL